MVEITNSSESLANAATTVPLATSKSPTVNIIITGECQQGKSTLIRQLIRYAGAKDVPIGIGDGNRACTMDVGNYDIPIKLRAFQLIDAAGQPIKREQYPDLIALEEDDIKVVEVGDIDAPTVTFRFVDTPGLNDTQGEDYSIMSRILTRAADLGHVNALVYVRSVESNFGSSFKNFFRYIQQSMPSISSGLIVVHSCFTVDRVVEFLEENQKLDDIRRQAFESATDLKLEHFFMDNSPDPTSPFAVSQSLNEIFRFLQHLVSQKPLPVTSMKLLKTEDMKHIDIHVSNALKSLQHRLNKSWNEEKGNAETVKANAMSAQREISKLKSKIETRQSRIRLLNTDEEILLGKKSCIENYSFFGDLCVKGKLNLGNFDLTYDSEYPITSVTKTCSPGSKWQHEELRGSHWSGKLFGNLFRDVNGTATFYTTSKLKHQAEIETLEAAVVDLQDHLESQMETLSRNTNGGAPDTKLSRLGDTLARVEEIVEVAERDWFDVNLWPQFKAFYTKHTTPTLDDIRAYVKVYDEDVGKLL
ncbi:unnamed protein product [Clonostachys rhizophaga]|uniref:G domain-containing protein n=1 Tax=Clonostachys rhizophaga TaxID=160324 RepID=A0A9N9YLR6_9HYPO|nr:unnamed protein product [Clonostachys rhizophaga]